MSKVTNGFAEMVKGEDADTGGLVVQCFDYRTGEIVLANDKGVFTGIVKSCNRIVQKEAAADGELLEIGLHQLSDLSAIRMVSDVDAGSLRVWKEDFSTGSPIYSNEKSFTGDNELNESREYFDSLV